MLVHKKKLSRTTVDLMHFYVFLIALFKLISDYV